MQIRTLMHAVAGESRGRSATILQTCPVPRVIELVHPPLKVHLKMPMFLHTLPDPLTSPDKIKTLCRR